MLGFVNAPALWQWVTARAPEVTVDIGGTVHLVGRAVMAYPLSEGTWAAHVTFVDGQRNLIDLVDDYLATHSRLRSL